MIGLLGGTFAPIHNGHLRLAIEAREQLGLEDVRLIPAAAPPLRDVPRVPPRRRLHWVTLALQGESGLSVDGRELARSGPSYTYDTVAELRAELPKTPLCLLLGGDAVERFGQWHRWRELVDLCHIVTINRPGSRVPLPEALAALDRDAPDAAALRSRPGGLFFQLTMPPLPISASDIRRRIKAGRSIRGLVPESVIADLTKQDLQLLSQDTP